ncbi:unnamed protein product [Lota lota]
MVVMAGLGVVDGNQGAAWGMSPGSCGCVDTQVYKRRGGRSQEHNVSPPSREREECTTRSCSRRYTAQCPRRRRRDESVDWCC